MAPLLSRTPDLDGSGVRAWFLEPATVLEQVYGVDGMTLAVARFIVTELEAEVQRRFVSRGDKVRFVHDWRACANYEPAARSALLEWGRASRKHVARVTMALSPDAGPFMRIAATSAMAVLRVAGMKIDLADDFEPVLRELRSLAGE